MKTNLAEHHQQIGQAEEARHESLQQQQYQAHDPSKSYTTLLPFSMTPN